MAKQFNFGVSVATNTDVSAGKMAEIFQKVIDAGLVAVQKAAESGAGDLESAELASELHISTAVVAPRIVIGLQGGIIQGATANMPIEYLVYDYDIEGASKNEVAIRPALDGGEVEVFDSGVRTSEIAAQVVAKIFEAAET